MDKIVFLTRPDPLEEKLVTEVSELLHHSLVDFPRKETAGKSIFQAEEAPSKDIIKNLQNLLTTFPPDLQQKISEDILLSTI